MNKRNPVLLSIKPNFASLIFEGTKTVELRKSKIKIQADDLVVVYVSSPVMSICGAFVVNEVCSTTPSKMWKQVSDKAQISKKEYDEYFRHKNVAYGISVKSAVEFTETFSLEQMRSILKINPPQSFRYLTDEHLATLDPIMSKALIRGKNNVFSLKMKSRINKRAATCRNFNQQPRSAGTMANRRCGGNST